MNKYFIVRRKNEVLFIKTSDQSMWEETIASYKYSQKHDQAEIFRNAVNEVMNTNFSISDLICIAPSHKEELFKKVIQA